jgi:hypothetical protein
MSYQVVLAPSSVQTMTQLDSVVQQRLGRVFKLVVS